MLGLAAKPAVGVFGVDGRYGSAHEPLGGQGRERLGGVAMRLAVTPDQKTMACWGLADDYFCPSWRLARFGEADDRVDAAASWTMSCRSALGAVALPLESIDCGALH